MRRPLHLISCLLLLVTLTCAAQTPPAAAGTLFVVHFEVGPKWNPSLPPTEQASFAEHGANLGRLRKAGDIVFGARYGELGMIFIKAASLESAKAVIEADPGVRAGIFVYRIAPLNVFYPWQ